MRKLKFLPKSHDWLSIRTRSDPKSANFSEKDGFRLHLVDAVHGSGPTGKQMTPSNELFERVKGTVSKGAGMALGRSHRDGEIP